MAIKFRKESKPEAKAKSSKVDQSQVTSMVQKRAYEIYQKRGKTPGNPTADWLEAEKQIKRELSLK